MNQAVPFDIARPVPGANGPVASRPALRPHTRIPADRRRWPMRHLAAAAVLLLALGLGAVALGRGWWSDSPERNTIPAAVAPAATPTPEPAAELLLELTLPAPSLPRGAAVSAGLAHSSVPPGTRSIWEPRQPYCCPGPLVEYVVAGTYTIRADAAPVRVVRAGGAVEEVPAGTEVTLGLGDALVSRNETVVEAANTGETPVELLHWVMIADGGFGGHQLPGWGMHETDTKTKVGSSGRYGLRVPEGAATVRLRRVELEPGATVSAPPSGATSFAVTLGQNAAGTPMPAGALATRGDGTIRNVDQAAVTAYVLTLEPAEPGATASPAP